MLVAGVDAIPERLDGRLWRCYAMVGSCVGKEVLNIGCSFGWFERFATNDGTRRVTGIDVDETTLSKAKRWVPRAQFLLASAFQLPFKPRSFDVVAMFDVIEHLPAGKEPKAFEEARTMLRDGGVLCLSTPNRSLFSNLLDPAWYLMGHRHYSRRDLEQLLSQSGFRIQSVGYGGGSYELIGMIIFYIWKWVFHRPMPFKTWFDAKRDREYRQKKAFATIFVKAYR